MRIKQAIIPAILALSAAGSILLARRTRGRRAGASSVVAAPAQHGVMYFHD